jgi:formylglycine-generating enzyme required for sulfatase activity
MDYLRSLELRMAAMQRKIRLLQDLVFFFDSASAEELAQFSEELRSVYTASGASLAGSLAAILGGAEAGRPPRPAPTSPATTAAENAIRPPAGVVDIKMREQPDSTVPTPAPAPTPPEIKPVAPEGPSAPDARAELLALIEPSMIGMPASTFVMGSESNEDEKPPHKVTLSAYRICDHLATNREYSLFVAANPQWSKDRADPALRDERYLDDWSSGSYPEGKDDHPVAFVSYHAARAFAEWIGKRLPTEAEWECAARGGLVGKKYPNGDLMNDKLANLAKQYRGTTEVRRFEPNGYKLYDMAGNLFEWTADWFAPYPPGEARDPAGPAEGDRRVVRGGSWMSGAGALRVSARVDMEETSCGQVGIRLAG